MRWTEGQLAVLDDDSGSTVEVENCRSSHRATSEPAVVAPAGLPAHPELHLLVLHGRHVEPPVLRRLPDSKLLVPVPQLGRRQQVGEGEHGRVELEQAAGVADVPVDVPRGVHAAALEPEGVERDRDSGVLRERPPAALAAAVGGDPGARVLVVDGEADGVEAEPARVRAREHRGADDVPKATLAVARQRVARGLREQRAAAGGRVEDEDAGEDTGGERRREEEHEAEVDVVDGEALGPATAEAVEGEARGEGGGGGVEGGEGGGVEGGDGRDDVRREGRVGGVEEVAEEWGRRGRDAACGNAVPAVAGEGGAEEVGRGEAVEDAE
uniref:Uncharacterized protein n=1 Tax=Oryza glumipatula TaxID=40148 RepID=A0A0E0B0C4_9ORYZ